MLSDVQNLPRVGISFESSRSTYALANTVAKKALLTFGVYWI